MSLMHGENMKTVLDNFISVEKKYAPRPQTFETKHEYNFGLLTMF